MGVNLSEYPGAYSPEWWAPSERNPHLTVLLLLSYEMGSASQSDLSFPFDLLYTLNLQLVLLVQHWLDVVGLG